MQMLKAGGIPLFTDNIRKADIANPRGYYEHEKVKELETNPAVIESATGYAVKVLTHLLEYLPEKLHYKTIFIERNIEEILISQEKMLAHLDKMDVTDRDHYRQIYTKHLSQVKKYIAGRNATEVMYIRYDDIIRDPKTATHKIEQFLERNLDKEAMVEAVEPQLYRTRTNEAEADEENST